MQEDALHKTFRLWVGRWESEAQEIQQEMAGSVDVLVENLQKLSLSDIPAPSEQFTPRPSPGLQLQASQSKSETILFHGEEYDLRCSSSQEYFKVVLNADFTCLQFNIGYKTKPCIPTAQQRKDLISSILRTVPVDLYFIQESGWKSLATHIETLRGASHVNFTQIGSNSLILYDTTKFKSTPIPESVINSCLRNVEQIDRAEFAVARLTLTYMAAQAFEFLAFSWHCDQYGRKNPAFMQFCYNLAAKLELPVLIGGDFNKGLKATMDSDSKIAHSSDQDLQALFQNDALPFYIPTQTCYRSRVIDFYVASLTVPRVGRTGVTGGSRGIKLHNVQELPHEASILGDSFQKFVDQHGARINLANIVDHFPVIAYANVVNMKIAKD